MEKYMAKNKNSNKLIIKIVISIILSLALNFSFHYFISKSLIAENKYNLTYAEKGEVNYQVCLKTNDFYEDTCLEKGMKYVASLIDTIKLDLKYVFSTNVPVTSSYNYSIVGVLYITDPIDNSVIYNKEYTIVKETTHQNKDIKNYLIEEIVDIDYTKYNDFANQFKRTYGINSNSKLNIFLKVNNVVNSSEHDDLHFEKDSELIVSLPLTESSINVEVNSANIDNSNTLSSKMSVRITNYYMFFAAVLSLLGIAIVLYCCFISLKKNYHSRSKYEKEVGKILREYDRLIVETDTTIDTEKYNIIIINSFQEMVDVHDNLKMPIIYNEVIHKKESNFYIKNDKDLYLYVVKQ